MTQNEIEALQRTVERGLEGVERRLTDQIRQNNAEGDALRERVAVVEERVGQVKNGLDKVLGLLQTRADDPPHVVDQTPAGSKLATTGSSEAGGPRFSRVDKLIALATALAAALAAYAQIVHPPS